MPRIQTTKVYSELDQAVKAGYTTISEQGSSRSGKTRNTVIWLCAFMMNQPGLRLSVVRKTLTALRGSVLLDFKEVLIQFGLWDWDKKAFNKSEFVFTFPNGSWIEFFSTDDEQKLRGRKRDICYVNEANELSQLEWQQLKMRTSMFTIVDYNPSFSDDHWLCAVNSDPRTYHFITTYKDNPFLEQTIIDEIESLRTKNKSLWQVYGLGLQAVIEGLIFTNVQIIDEIPDYAKKHHWRGMDFGYACFKGDTLITTEKGQVRIDQIKPGDRVLTRKGYQKVKRCFDNGTKEVIINKIAVGGEVVTMAATSNHNFNVNGKWKKYGQLMKGDRLCVALSSTGMSTEDTQKGSTRTTISTSGRKKDTTINGYSTMQFGSSTTGPSQTSISSTTRTKTHSIMTYRTSCSSHHPSIVESIKTTFSDICRSILTRLPNMDSQKRIGGAEGKKSTKNLKSANGSAPNAEMSTHQPTCIKNSARPLVTGHGDLLTHHALSKGLVNGAGESTRQTSSTQADAAAKIAHIDSLEVSSLERVGTERCEVYDLEIEGVHEYFANGILVHNCDPTAIEDVYFHNNTLYIDEICYNTGMLSSDIIRVLKEHDGAVETISESADPRLIQEVYRGGCNVKPVVKYGGSVQAGVTKMLEYSICITKQSFNVIKEFKNYTWAQDKEGKWLNQPIDAYNHCFVGDTLIATATGQKRISDINPGESVMTTGGYRQVLENHNNGTKKVFHYSLNFGNFITEVICTPDHKIKTTKGWKKIQDLEAGDTLFVSREMLNAKQGQNLTEKPISFIKGKDISPKGQSGCTLRYGSIITDLFRRAMRFIIKISTLLITTFQTLNASPRRNTKKGIKSGVLNGESDQSSLNTLTESARRPLHGTGVRPEENGTHSTQGKSLQKSSRKDLRVNVAERSSGQKNQTQNSAQITASQNGAENRGLTLRRESASGAGQSSLQTNTQRPNTVVEVVLSSITVASKSGEEREVYDLTVEDIHEYIANGIVVHNCIDGIRYVVMMKLMGGRPKPVNLTKLANIAH